MSLYKKKLIIREKKFQRSLPSNLNIEDVGHFTRNAIYHCPNLCVYFFKSTYLLPDSTLFLFRLFPISSSFLYFRGRIKHHSIKGIIDIQRLWRTITFNKTDKPYLIIHDQWTSNYYHWMTQALPRLLLTFKMGIPFTLLLPEDHNKPFHFDSLKALGISNFTQFEVGEIYYKVYNLIYPAHDIQIGDYQDELMQELSSNLRSENARQPKHKYLFIQRSSKGFRTIINEEEVLSLLSKWNFEIIDFEKLSFEEQKRAVSDATILAGVHGAGLTNMLFMEKGSRVLELTTILNGEQYYYFTLSNALGHQYFYQLCEPDIKGKSIQESNIIVDIKQLDKTLAQMVNNGHD